MKIGIDNTDLFTEIEQIINNMGFEVVDFNFQQMKNGVQSNIIIYNKEGISTGDCSKVFKTVRPRMELKFDNENINLEVSSPGITRNISAREFKIFEGKGVKVLLNDESEWKTGLIVKGDSELIIKNNNNTQNFKFEDINKAKLDYTQEVR